jgi:hypothetical protein
MSDDATEEELTEMAAEQRALRPGRLFFRIDENPLPGSTE